MTIGVPTISKSEGNRTMQENAYYPKLFEPGRIGRVVVRNRIVMSPLGTTFWSASGEVTDRIIEHYVARARGGAGLITVSFASINYPPGYQAQASLALPRNISWHYRLVEKLHSYGSKVSLQLTHQGRSMFARAGFELVSCSSIPAVSFGESDSPIPRALERGEIHQIVDLYAIIANNAKKAGYDMVEIHGAHGYLVASFMSPYLNTRNDEFGGTLRNRMRFCTELIRRIKEVVGDDYPVGIRFSGDEFIEGGITTEESVIMAQMLEEAGAAFIHVSSGTYETLHKSNDIMRLPEGWKSYIWRAAKKAVRIPTFAAGGIKTPEFSEKLIREGKADFVALGRPLFADPEWPNKAREGRVEDIRKCVSCMECFGFVTARAEDTCCAINVAVGREREFGQITPAQNKKNIMVIGAGPGGMEAARVAALRGHEVTLYDRREEVGGQLLLAATPPGKEKLLWFRDYQTTQLKKLHVKLQLGVQVTPDLVDEKKPDAIIVATGSQAIIPEIPGIGNGKVLTALEVLERKRKIRNQRVVIAGGGMVGAETAEFMADLGNTVTIVEMLPRIAGDMEPLNRRGLMDALEEKKIVMLTEHEISEVTDKGAVVLDKKNGKRKLIEADWVILAMGAKPASEMAEALGERFSQLYVIGDCQQPRTIMAAVYEGAFAALQI